MFLGGFIQVEGSLVAESTNMPNLINPTLVDPGFILTMVIHTAGTS